MILQTSTLTDLISTQSSSQTILTISQLVLRHIYILLSNRIGSELILSIFLFSPFMSVPRFHLPPPPSLHLASICLSLYGCNPLTLYMQTSHIYNAVSLERTIRRNQYAHACTTDVNRLHGKKRVNRFCCIIFPVLVIQAIQGSYMTFSKWPAGLQPEHTLRSIDLLDLGLRDDRTGWEHLGIDDLRC